MTYLALVKEERIDDWKQVPSKAWRSSSSIQMKDLGYSFARGGHSTLPQCVNYYSTPSGELG